MVLPSKTSSSSKERHKPDHMIKATAKNKRRARGGGIREGFSEEALSEQGLKDEEEFIFNRISP